jgi:hypothetical protein
MRTIVIEALERFNEQGCINDVIDWLRENSFIPEEDLDIKSISEQEYDDALNKLKSNYMSISKEDEQTIINIAKRF